MKNMSKWMLGAAMAAGVLSLGAGKAQAAQIGIYVGAPVAYAPPCPGPGYVWTAGYYSGGYWVPGRWDYVGDRRDWDGDRVYRYDGDRYWDHDRGWHGHRDRDWDLDRDWDRDHDRGWDRDGDRHWDHDRR